MGLLDKFALAYLFDSEYTDDAGLRRTKDRSRHGIHALVGDGSTAATMPTWDSSRGLYTFDGGDYLTIRQADDAGDVLANMGSIQDETYCFLMDPLILAQQEFLSTNDGINPRIIIRTIAGGTNRFELQLLDAGGGIENTLTPNNTVEEFVGKATLMAFSRIMTGATMAHSISMNGAVRWTSSGLTPRNASSAKDPHIGSTPTPSSYFAAGTGLRFFGYARRAITVPELRQLSRNLRGVL